MMTIAAVTEFLGWASVINISILLLSTICLLTMRTTIPRIHAKLFSLEEQDLRRAYFQYLTQYKIITIVLNIVPYIALKIMA
ncbi:MAG: hypothetical protein RBR22_07705 [Desulfuromonas sp.]|nr:hypothetical protein [Desulfuromonas sp.]